jgi:indolepyruvate ferredoxin oxidoreductase beta subunit
MSPNVKQQIVISGVGGQGVLFVTRLLAEAAMARKLPVFTSETHGMAQRGGTVVSHFKVGGFSSPLIRPGRADGVLILKAENLQQHGAFLKPGGWSVVNCGGQTAPLPAGKVFSIDADDVARKIGQLKSVNLVTLGYALTVSGKMAAENGRLFCSLEEITAVVKRLYARKEKQISGFLGAIQAGYAAF